MLREMWTGLPGTKQLSACVSMASGEALPDVARGKNAPATERWQYASVQALTAPEFLSYGCQHQIFSSADSNLTAGTFGVTSSNTMLAAVSTLGLSEPDRATSAALAQL